MKKQSISTITLICILLLMTSIFNSCVQEETFTKATVETSQATYVTEATAICGGVISADGGSSITAWGICWSTSPNPTIENDTTIGAAGTSVFSSSIKGLSPGTTYYVRAYAVNKGGIAYGLNAIFTTKTFSITTTPVAISLITATSAIGGGNIISDGDSSTLTVIARGVCWNTFPSPTIENSKTTDGVGGGRFTSKIDSLTAFTTYYVRAYATNGNGTIYGDEVSFTTQNGVIGLTTDEASAITDLTATSGGAIISDGGAPVTERGICWSTSSSPTIANSKTTDGSGTGTFISNITELTQGTTYFIRSYATNSVGISYGNEVSFTTLVLKGTVTDVEGNVYNFTTIGTQVWMVENLKTTKYNDGTSIPLVFDPSSWIVLSAPGYCFYNYDPANKTTYGALYNWFTVNTGKLAPTGWHVPTDAEWTTLTTYLGGEAVAGGKLKEAGSLHWTSPNTGATNSTGFSALPGGYRYWNGSFAFIGDVGFWWSSTEGSTGRAWYRSMSCNSSDVYSDKNGLQYGFSVRCVRD